jgi:antitoxin component YwqK of YwqJK toxin-antitoxin module
METKVERAYWGNGKLQSERPYVDGMLHGMERWWWESGQLWSEYSYEGGKRHGVEKQWNQNGDIAYFCLYNQNEQVAKFYPRNETQRWKLK